MHKYKNLSGKSKVAAYQINNDSIIIRYVDKTVHLFTEESAGARNIAQMKKLAIEGRGLYDFINNRVLYRYARKY